LKAGDAVRVNQGRASVTLPAREDATLAANVVRIAAGHASTAALGAMFGRVQVERAETRGSATASAGVDGSKGLGGSASRAQQGGA
jgi:hypothetical protein